jgi:hypothetical protein
MPVHAVEQEGFTVDSDQAIAYFDGTEADPDAHTLVGGVYGPGV